MEEYDIVRTIHMNAEQPDGEPSASPLGYSVGRWEEETLVVQTTRINWPYFDDSGIPQSESVEILERFTLSEGDRRLEYEITVTDPEAFTEPVIGISAWAWVAGQEVQPYNCELDE